MRIAPKAYAEAGVDALFFAGGMTLRAARCDLRVQ